MQNFGSFDIDGKFILASGATMSMGGVDLLQRIQKIYAGAGIQLTSRPVSHNECFRSVVRGPWLALDVGLNILNMLRRQKNIASDGIGSAGRQSSSIVKVDQQAAMLHGT